MSVLRMSAVTENKGDDELSGKIARVAVCQKDPELTLPTAEMATGMRMRLTRSICATFSVTKLISDP